MRGKPNRQGSGRIGLSQRHDDIPALAAGQQEGLLETRLKLELDRGEFQTAIVHGAYADGYEDADDSHGD
jgi:hypothetical protein